MDQQLDRDRLARILGMLGSLYDGEIATAGRLAHEMVRDAGLTWHDVVTPTLALPEPARHREIASDDDAIYYALDFADVLSEWEFGFCRSLARQKFPVTPKQRTVLAGIVDKVRLAETRAA